MSHPRSTAALAHRPVLWSVTRSNGRSSEALATCWLEAFLHVSPELGLDAASIAALRVLEGADGTFHVDVQGFGRVTLRPVQVRVRHVAPAEGSLRDDDVVELRDCDWTDEWEDEIPTKPMIEMPPASLAPIYDTFEERLFDATTRVEAGPVPDSCALVAELVDASVRPRGVVVATGTINDPGLVAVAALGPRAAAVRGRMQRHGIGPIGMSFDLGSAVELDAIGAGTIALDPVGEGDPCAVLCVPIVDPDGIRRGVVVAIHEAAHRFTEVDRAVLERLAQALAVALA